MLKLGFSESRRKLIGCVLIGCVLRPPYALNILNSLVTEKFLSQTEKIKMLLLFSLLLMNNKTLTYHALGFDFLKTVKLLSKM